MKIIFITVVSLSTICINSAFSQNLSLGNIYDNYKSIPKADDEQKALNKELKQEIKLNKASLEENLKNLQKAGYFKYIFIKNINNNDAKILLAVDLKLKNKQLELDSKILTLKDSDWLENLSKPLPEIPDGKRNIGISYGDQTIDNKAIDILKDLKGRYSKAVKSYTTYSSPVSASTNSNFIAKELLNFHKESDEENLIILEKSLAKKKQQYEERLIEIAEFNNKEKEYQRKREEEYRLAELERQKKIEQAQDRERKLETEIASLPSKESLIAKFRTYKHRSGYTLEMFPIGFTPKAGKPVTDYVTIFGRKYKGRYREVDENGMNTFIIEYYDSGSILSVTVYKGGNSIYTANYRDHAGKPYEIRSTSSDGKFYLVHKRIYDMYADNTNITTRYQYVPLDYWYE